MEVNKKRRRWERKEGPGQVKKAWEGAEAPRTANGMRWGIKGMEKAEGEERILSRERLERTVKEGGATWGLRENGRMRTERGEAVMTAVA